MHPLSTMHPLTGAVRQRTELPEDKAQINAGYADLLRPATLKSNPSCQRTSIVNRIVWLVGAVVIILFVLGYLGLR